MEDVIMAKTTGKYAVPQEIRDQKPRGTMVKKISGKYYVYEMKNIKDPQIGRASCRERV